MIISGGQQSGARAAEFIDRGGVIGFRTDTFYGLGVDPFNRDALKVLNELKGREGKPILVLISDEEAASRLITTRTRLFDALSARHWPGALTLVCGARAELPAELTAGTETVGVRLPADEEVRALVRACGGALTATSANPAGMAPARTASEVESYFRGRLDLIVDGGESAAERPSTVLDVSSNPPVLIREGVMTRGELASTFRELGVTLVGE